MLLKNCYKLAETALYGKIMKTVIYVRLLNEGSEAYRPVPAIHVKGSIFQILGAEIYDTEDEQWEFEPGTNVFVEEQIKSETKILVAIRKGN